MHSHKLRGGGSACQETAFIALGCNLGNCRATFIAARHALAQRGVVVVASSPLYKTQAVGGPADQPDYLNAVLRVETCLGAHELLQLCLAVELEAGRQRQEHWGPRTLDLDLLLYAQLVCNFADLILPHPRLHQRRFVLEPLCVLAGHAQHPTLGLSFNQLLLMLPADQLQQGVHMLDELW